MKKLLVLFFLLFAIQYFVYSQAVLDSFSKKGYVVLKDINNSRSSGWYTLGIPNSHTEALLDVSGFLGSTPRFQLRFQYGEHLYFRAARNRENNWDSQGFRELAIYDATGNLNIGRPNNSFGLKKGSYSIQFYGYRDIKSNVISAKISAERTSACCNWKAQGTDLAFYTVRNITESNSDNSKERMRIKDNGNVGIGTSVPDSKLTVKGTVHAQEVKVDLSGSVAPDYVFGDNYDLLSLEEVADHIKEHKHLPGIPSASVMDKEGVNLKELNLKLLEKIEELTLYTLSQESKLNSQSLQLASQSRALSKKEKALDLLSSRLSRLESLLEDLTKTSTP